MTTAGKRTKGRPTDSGIVLSQPGCGDGDCSMLSEDGPRDTEGVQSAARPPRQDDCRKCTGPLRDNQRGPGLESNGTLKCRGWASDRRTGTGPQLEA